MPVSRWPVIVLIAALATNFSALDAQVAIPAADNAATVPQKELITGNKRTNAAFTSMMLGFGIGHSNLGYRDVAKTFGRTQLLGIVSATVGLGMAFNGSGKIVGESLMYGGMGLYLGCRLWEFVDVIARPAVSNARILAERRKSQPPGIAQLSVAPSVGRGQRGLAVNIRF